MKKVVILDGQTIQTLPVAKSLKKQGFYVIVLGDNKNSYGYRTFFADEKIVSPSTKDEPHKFHKFLLSFLQGNRIDIMLPMNDYSAQYMSEHKALLQNYCDFVIPDYDIFMSGYDKNLLMKVCLKNDFAHPRTADLSCVDAEKAGKYVGFPALIKPNETTGARGFAIVETTKDIIKKLPAIQNEYGACHLQEFIPPGGKQFKVQLFVHEDELINSTVLHKIRFYPEKGGSSCFNQTIEREDLVELCFRVLKKIKWIGFADFDLIEDTRDGVVKIMEINPRLPACIKASLNSGVDFVENIVDVSQGLAPRKYSYYPGEYLRYFGLDALWFLNSKRRFRVHPSWFRGFFSSRQSFQDGGWDDLKPLLFGTFGAFLKQLNPKFRKAKKEMKG